MPGIPRKIVPGKQRGVAQFASVRIEPGGAGMPDRALQAKAFDVDRARFFRQCAIAVRNIISVKRNAIDVCGSLPLIIPVKVNGPLLFSAWDIELEPALIEKLSPMKRRPDRLESQLPCRCPRHRSGLRSGERTRDRCDLRPDERMDAGEGAVHPRKGELEKWIFRKHRSL